MSKLSGSQARSAFEFVAKRDSVDDNPIPIPLCAKKDATCKGRLVLHHKDGNNAHNPGDGSNWGILCVSHNRREVVVARSLSNKFGSALKMGHSFETMQAEKREKLGVRGISAELEKSERVKPQVENWIIQAVTMNKAESVEEAKNSCSYLFKCDQTMVGKIIKGMTSREGPLEFTSPEKEHIRLKGKP